MAESETIDIQAGGSNIHYGRIAYWLALLITRGLRGTTVNIKVGEAYRDLRAVGAGLAQLGVTTPAIAARQCQLGQAGFDRPSPELRSIGVVPHRDGLVFAVVDELDVRSIDDVRERRVPVRLAVGPQWDLVGQGAYRALEAYGLTPASVTAFGGQWIEVPSAQAGWKLMADGKVDALVHESVVMAFRPLSRVRPIRLLSMRPEVLDQLEARYGYTRTEIPPGTCVGQDDPVAGLNWDHWIVVANAGVPDEVAQVLADGFLNRRFELERQYTADGRLPWGEHPLDFPIQPEVIANEVTVPLHPAAERCYRAAGVLR